MDVHVNGKVMTVPDTTTLEALCAMLKVDRERVIAELNEAVVRRARWNETVLAEGDHLELISLVGGG